MNKMDIWALLPSITEEVNEYELRGDNGDYTPNEHERFLMEDFGHGFMEMVVDKIHDKLNMRKSISVESLKNVIRKVCTRINPNFDGVIWISDDTILPKNWTIVSLEKISKAIKQAIEE